MTQKHFFYSVIFFKFCINAAEKKWEAKENMILRYTRKGKNLLVEEAEFQEYITKQLRELINLSTNVVAALIMISLIVVFTYFKVSDYFFLGLIIIPLIGRTFIREMVAKWLRKHFKELLKFSDNLVL